MILTIVPRDANAPRLDHYTVDDDLLQVDGLGGYGFFQLAEGEMASPGVERPGVDINEHDMAGRVRRNGQGQPIPPPWVAGAATRTGGQVHLRIFCLRDSLPLGARAGQTVTVPSGRLTPSVLQGGA